MAAPTSLFSSAFRFGKINRMGEMIVMVFEGEGACVVPFQDFNAMARWAESRVPSGNLQRDREQIFDHLDTVIARPGSCVATKGNRPALRRLRDTMQQFGLDARSFQLPSDLDTPAVAPAPAPTPAPAMPATVTQSWPAPRPQARSTLTAALRSVPESGMPWVMPQQPGSQG